MTRCLLILSLEQNCMTACKERFVDDVQHRVDGLKQKGGNPSDLMDL